MFRCDSRANGLATIAAMVTLCALPAGQTSKPERKVKSNVIISPSDPQARIELRSETAGVAAKLSYRWKTLAGTSNRRN
jgi:hypothetical protein